MGKEKKTAIVHDWIDVAGGAEAILEALIRNTEPDKVFCLLANSKSILKEDLGDRLKTSGLQKLPFAFKLHRYLLQFYPHFIESFDLRDYEQIISSSHCVAKGVLTRADQLHLSYVHTPARYLWDQSFDYLDWSGAGFFRRLYMQWVFHRLRQWDVSTANRVDLYLANSWNVSQRIWKTYRRKSVVLYPFVDLKNFPYESNRSVQPYFVVLSRLVSQKRVDIAIDACKSTNLQLKVIGDGPLLQSLKRRAGPTVEFLGRLPHSELTSVVREARALIFPQEEDFGIVPIECQALGVPVIAYRKGGALETVVEGVTGEFFDDQSPGSLAAVLTSWDPDRYDSKQCRESSLRFSRERFDERLRLILEQSSEEFGNLKHLDDDSLADQLNSDLIEGQSISSKALVL